VVPDWPILGVLRRAEQSNNRLDHTAMRRGSFTSCRRLWGRRSRCPTEGSGPLPHAEAGQSVQVLMVLAAVLAASEVVVVAA